MKPPMGFRNTDPTTGAPVYLRLHYREENTAHAYARYQVVCGDLVLAEIKVWGTGGWAAGAGAINARFASLPAGIPVTACYHSASDAFRWLARLGLDPEPLIAEAQRYGASASMLAEYRAAYAGGRQ